MYKLPKNPQAIELTKSTKDRSISLTTLKVIKIDNIRYCAWCTEEKLSHGNQRYCSDLCRDSATAWAYPQKEDGLKFLLIRQDYKCLLCQYDYRPFLDVMVEEYNRRYKGAILKIEELVWHHFKKLKDRVPQDRKPEVDHILPIFKGGESLGLENHQILCRTCHRAKTSKDLSKN